MHKKMEWMKKMGWDKHEKKKYPGGDQCIVLRSSCKTHNISWYAVPCNDPGIQRFFICERPCLKSQPMFQIEVNISF